MPPPFPAAENAGEQAPQELPLRGPGGPNQGGFGGPAPQLPPQMFTTAAQLLDLTDKKLLLVLRDGRKLVGVLRSWDQFANIVLQDTVERYFAADMYADVKRGIFLVRGENVLLLGEIDLDKDDEPPQGYREAEPSVVHAAWKEEQAARRTKDRSKGKALGREGFEAEHSGEALFW